MKNIVLIGMPSAGKTTIGKVLEEKLGKRYVDMDDEGKGTMARSKKDSFYWYQKCIKSNGDDIE